MAVVKNFVSDLSGKELLAKDAAQIVIRRGEEVRILDVTMDEAESAFKGHGRVQKKRGRKAGTKNTPAASK